MAVNCFPFFDNYLFYSIIQQKIHQNIKVDITFSMLSCLVQEICHNIHNLVMAESKMATTRCFCDDSSSVSVQSPKLYNCTKCHAFMIR